MTRVKKLAFVALMALTLAGGASSPALAAPPPECPFIPELCEEDEGLTRKVNEYEGQHLASQDDDNTSDVYKKGSFDITLTGDPSQWG